MGRAAAPIALTLCVLMHTHVQFRYLKNTTGWRYIVYNKSSVISVVVFSFNCGDSFLCYKFISFSFIFSFS